MNSSVNIYTQLCFLKTGKCRISFFEHDRKKIDYLYSIYSGCFYRTLRKNEDGIWTMYKTDLGNLNKMLKSNNENIFINIKTYNVDILIITRTEMYRISGLLLGTLDKFLKLYDTGSFSPKEIYTIITL